MTWVERMYSWAEGNLGLPAHTLSKLLATVALVVVVILVRRLGVALFTRRIDDPSRRYMSVKILNYTLGLIVLLVVLRMWLGGVSGLAASIGIVSAGVAIALHEPLANLAGWAFLTIRRPFTIGDRVQIGNHAGDVVDVRLFAFSLIEIGNWVDADQSTGRILHIPNGVAFREPIANYTQGFNFIWNELPVTVTFESNWRQAKQLLTEIATRHSAIRSDDAAREVRRAASRYLIRYEHLTPIVWTSVAASGITLTIRFLTDPRRRRSSEAAIWEDVLDAFAGATDIDFAYPTQRFYDNVVEGKPDARAEPIPRRQHDADPGA
jgi:small-conductance mechanosensitive channel